MSDGENRIMNRGDEISPIKWIGIFILSVIPIIGQILILVWAFGNTRNRTFKNWAIANILIVVIGIILSIGLCSVGVGAGMLSASP